MKRPLISISSDFGIQSQGVGIMEATAISINEDAHVVHLMHGLPDFDITTAARTMETTSSLPVGSHVCVVDPGVGTKRKGIAIQTKRGDYLVGPDNGVLMPAVSMLGGFVKAVTLENPKYQRQPVSPLFHGRDVFTPAAAWLSKGIPIEDFGKELKEDELTPAPYQEAKITGNKINAQVIHINKFGSLFLNILPKLWDEFGVKLKEDVMLDFGKNKVKLPYMITFGEVSKGSPLMMKDDYGRIEVSLNMDDFSSKHNIKVGDKVVVVRG